MLKMYLNTKYFLQMYLNTKYIDVFKYFKLVAYRISYGDFAVCKDRSRDYNDRQCGSDVNWDLNLRL